MAPLTWDRQALIFGYALEHVAKNHGIGGDIEDGARGARYVSFSVRLWDERDLPKALKLGPKMADRARATTVVVQHDAGVVVYQFELRQGFWRTYTCADLKSAPGVCGVGFTDGQRQVNLRFKPHAHTLVAGTTGSGKTESVKTMLVGLFTGYQPKTELEAIIVDPKNDYRRAFEHSAHLTYPIAREDYEIEHVLTQATKELKRRIGTDQRDADGPRLVVVVDEAETILMNKQLLGKVGYIASMGREFNVNLILSSQEPTKKNLPGVLGNVMNRWCGKLSDARIAVDVTGQAKTAVQNLGMHGDFLHLGDRRPERLQVAMATSADYDRLPRAETPAPPPAEDTDTPDFEEAEEEPEPVYEEEGQRGPGRPPTRIEADKAGLYLAYPGEITPSQAYELIGLAKHSHYKYQEWVIKQIESARKWRAELGRNGK